VFSQTLGSTPDRRLVVEWNNVKRYSSSGAELSGLTLQAVLFESSNNILFQYQSLTSTVAANATGGTATVGIEFAGGASGYQHSFNTAGSVHAGLAILFTPETAPGPMCDPTSTPTTTATVTQTPTITPTPVARIFFPVVGQVGH